MLNSDDFFTLNPGYWVLYMGPYTSKSAAQAALPTAVSKGYSDAYVRQRGRVGGHDLGGGAGQRDEVVAALQHQRRLADPEPVAERAHVRGEGAVGAVLQLEARQRVAAVPSTPQAISTRSGRNASTAGSTSSRNRRR